MVGDLVSTVHSSRWHFYVYINVCYVCVYVLSLAIPFGCLTEHITAVDVARCVRWEAVCNGKGGLRCERVPLSGLRKDIPAPLLRCLQNYKLRHVSIFVMFLIIRIWTATVANLASLHLPLSDSLGPITGTHVCRPAVGGISTTGAPQPRKSSVDASQPSHVCIACPIFHSMPARVSRVFSVFHISSAIVRSSLLRFPKPSRRRRANNSQKPSTLPFPSPVHATPTLSFSGRRACNSPTLPTVPPRSLPFGLLHGPSGSQPAHHIHHSSPSFSLPLRGHVPTLLRCAHRSSRESVAGIVRRFAAVP